MDFSIYSSSIGESGGFKTGNIKDVFLAVFVDEDRGEGGMPKVFGTLSRKFYEIESLDLGLFRNLFLGVSRQFKLLNVVVVAVDGKKLFAASMGAVILKLNRRNHGVTLLSGGLYATFVSGNIFPDDTLNIEGKPGNGISGAIIKIGRKNNPFNLSVGRSLIPVVKLRSFLSDKISGRTRPFPAKTSVGISPDGVRKNRVLESVGIILILLLITSIFFGFIKKRSSQNLGRYKESVAVIENKIRDASNIYPLDPNHARELLDEAESGVAEFEKENKKLPPQELVEKISAMRKSVFGEYPADPQLFVDLSLLSEGFGGGFLTSQGSEIFVYDKAAHKLAKVETASKRSEMVAGPKETENTVAVVPSATKVYLLGKNGVNETGGKKVIEDEISEDGLGIFYAGNLYLLNSEKSQIFKYALTETGFVKAQEWLSEGVEINLKGTKSFVSDGFLWILDGDSNTIKLSRGNRLKFSLSGISPFSPDNLFTGEDEKNLYFLEKIGGRIIVTDKDGKYRLQYLSEKFKDAQEIFVSEKAQKAFYLNGPRIFVFGLERIEN